MRRQLGGGLSNMTPQKGRSWSAGIDLAPRFLPGFTAAFTYFHNKFIGGVSSPSPSAIVNSAGLRNLLTICPQTCSPAQIDEFANIANGATVRSEEHTSELQSLMRISYAVFCLKTKTTNTSNNSQTT